MASPEGLALIAAIAGAVATLATVLVNWRLGRRKAAIDMTASLSESEAKFRRDILAELAAVKKDLAECQKQHLACHERTASMQRQIDVQREEIAVLRSEIARANGTLPAAPLPLS